MEMDILTGRESAAVILSRPLLLISIAFLGLIALRSIIWRRTPSSNKAPPCIAEDIPLVGAYSFWTERWQFFQRAMKATATGNFSFFIGKHPVVGLSGDESRKTFFESKQFGLTEGYGVLFGMFPSTEVKNAEGDDTFITVEFATYFKERVTRMVRREVTERSGSTQEMLLTVLTIPDLPTLISDTRARLQELVDAPVHITDPFDSVYKLVYLLTTRTVGCTEIALNRRLLDQTLGWYETIAQCATAVVILFPWFPSVNLIKRYICGARLFFTLRGIINSRKKSGKREQDPLQDMVDRGDETSHIVGVMMGALFAAQQNSGINVAWILLHLASSPYWLDQAREEVQRVAQKYNIDPSVSLVDKIAALPLEAWETEFPTLELCLRDSIRLHALGACFRKNVSNKDVILSKGEAIPAQVFASYHMSDVHLDPGVYPDPLRWDPGRYLPDRAEDKKKPLAYIGWGAGRHPCLGRLFAKLEQNIILAMFLAMFEEFTLSDSQGNDVKEPPRIDLESYSSWKPKEQIRLKLRCTFLSYGKSVMRTSKYHTSRDDATLGGSADRYLLKVNTVMVEDRVKAFDGHGFVDSNGMIKWMRKMAALEVN